MGDNSNDNNDRSTSANNRGRGGNVARPWRGRGRGNWHPYRGNYRGATGPPKERPIVYSLPRDDDASSSDNVGAIPIGSQSQLVSVVLESEPGKYPGWKLYHPQEAYKEGTKTLMKVKAFEEHYKSKKEFYDIPKTRLIFWFPFHIQHILADKNFMSTWPNFQQDLVDNPENTLACAGLAMHQIVSELPTLAQSDLSSVGSTSNTLLQTIRARIHGNSPIVKLRSLKVNSYGKLITVCGTIVRAGASQINCSWLAFRCSLCHGQQAIRQTDGIFIQPTSCKSGCKARSNFIVLRESPFTRTEAVQTIRLQESMMGERFESGRVARSIEVELTQDLVDSVCPGDDVTITGILKVRPQDEQNKGQASMYKMYMQAVTIVNNKNARTSRTRISEFTPSDLKEIQLIHAEPCPFRLLVQSLCPSIYGHEMVKAGMILGLFGGSSTGKEGRRSEIHVLVVGDPGMGKSQMLQSCASVSPRGVLVCGNTSSNAGLTVTVRNEKGSGCSLEAGAIVLADQGACCIDEFDKMSGNHQALLEVMEQQTVSVAKAGVLCKIPARTSILAAANPSGGHYDKSKTVSENVKMNPALLSRFDLVFILLDRPDAVLDNLMTAHIQSLHCVPSINPVYSNNPLLQASRQSSNGGGQTPFYERLKLVPGEKMDLLPQVLMQKYIGYARKHINPKLTKEAANEIKRFYLELRRVQQGVETIPVTTRQIEALIRMTQARARIALSEEANLTHALDVIAIIRHSMIDVFSNDIGNLQMSRMMNGTGSSQASSIKKFIRVLQNQAVVMNKTVFSVDELKKIAVNGGISGNINQMLDSMNVQGFLLKKSKNLFKFIVD